MARPWAALQGFTMVDIILALVSLGHERARGIADRRMRVRGHGAGGFKSTAEVSRCLTL